MNSDGTGALVFGKDGEFPWASWSPDGRKLACLSPRGIDLYDIATKTVVSPPGSQGHVPANDLVSGRKVAYGRRQFVRHRLVGGPDRGRHRRHQCGQQGRLLHARLVSGFVDHHLLQPPHDWTQLWMADGEGRERRLVFAEDGRHIYGGCVSPDGNYVLFTGNKEEDGDPTNAGAPMGLLRLRDAPMVTGVSPAARKEHPGARTGRCSCCLRDGSRTGLQPIWNRRNEPKTSLFAGHPLRGRARSRVARSAPSPELAANGDTEVTAKLTAIGGDFPPNKLYDYMYVMKYHVLKVHRGKVEGEEIFVGHYNPLKPRAAAEDKYSGKVGGNVDRFQVGDVHRMALEAPLDEFFMGGIIDKHIKEKGTRYRAIWTDRASE